MEGKWEYGNNNLSFGGEGYHDYSWPPKHYSCSFCKREFKSAQALGGHMNVHRRDRARLKLLPASWFFHPNPNPSLSLSSPSSSPHHHHLDVAPSKNHHSFSTSSSISSYGGKGGKPSIPRLGNKRAHGKRHAAESCDQEPEACVGSSLDLELRFRVPGEEVLDLELRLGSF